MLTKQELLELFQRNSIAIDGARIEMILAYRDLLLDWNKKVNLISRNDTGNFDWIHLLDSALPARHLPDFSTAVDLGTGGGLPGIILAILFPERRFFLSDTRQKKIAVLADMIERLYLPNVTPFNAAAGKFPVKTDLLISRAFGTLKKIYGLAGNYVTKGGSIAAYKGTLEKTQEEIQELGAHRVTRTVSYTLECADGTVMERNLVLITV